MGSVGTQSCPPRQHVDDLDLVSLPPSTTTALLPLLVKDAAPPRPTPARRQLDPGRPDGRRRRPAAGARGRLWPAGVIARRCIPPSALLVSLGAAADSLPPSRGSHSTVKAGYPPRPVLWSSPAQPLASLKLAKNDQLIISASSSSSSDSTLVANGPPAPEVKPLSLPLKREAAAPAPAPPAAAPARSPPSQPPAAAARSAGGEDAAYVEVDGSFLVLYVVPCVALPPSYA